MDIRLEVEVVIDIFEIVEGFNAYKSKYGFEDVRIIAYVEHGDTSTVTYAGPFEQVVALVASTGFTQAESLEFVNAGAL